VQGLIEINLDEDSFVPECKETISGIHSMSNIKSNSNIRIDKCTRCGMEITQKRDLAYEESQKPKKKSNSGKMYELFQYRL